MLRFSHAIAQYCTGLLTTFSHQTRNVASETQGEYFVTAVSEAAGTKLKVLKCFYKKE